VNDQESRKEGKKGGLAWCGRAESKWRPNKGQRVLPHSRLFPKNKNTMLQNLRQSSMNLENANQKELNILEIFIIKGKPIKWISASQRCLF